MGASENTKERIAQAALDLFAKRGYGAVSIRDICREVGIRESTVYYHYENKRAILSALTDRVSSLAGEMQSRFDDRFQSVQSVSEKEMAGVAQGFLMRYYLHPSVYPLICTLSIERLSSEEALALYQDLVFDQPLAQQERVFGEMIARGIVKASDARALAEEYLAIIHLAFEMHCMGRMDEAAARAQIARGVMAMYQRIRSE